MKSDFSPIKHLFLCFPENFGDKYEGLTDFFAELIHLIPDNIHLYIIVNNPSSESTIKNVFKNKNLTTLLIEEFDEIWLRDMMGFNMGTHIAKPIFSPSYFKEIYTEDCCHLINAATKKIILKSIGVPIVDVPIKWDGGNMGTNGKIGILTDILLSDNPNLEIEHIKRIIKKELKLEPVIVPRSVSDLLGHIDGYLSFIDNKNVFLPSYPKLSSLGEEIEYVEQMKTTCKQLGFKINILHDRPVDEYVTSEKGEKLYSARGNYVNHMILNDTIIIPEYTLPNYKLERNYNQDNFYIMKKHFKEVRTINCDALSQLGGSLHCISWTY